MRADRDIGDGEYIIFDCEMNLEAGVFHVVYAVGIVLISGTGIFLQKLKGAFAEEFGDLLEKLLGNIYGDGTFSRCESESADGVGVGICVGEVGLDIINGCAVQKISACNVDDGTFGGIEFNADDLHRRNADRIGTER